MALATGSSGLILNPPVAITFRHRGFRPIHSTGNVRRKEILDGEVASTHQTRHEAEESPLPQMQRAAQQPANALQALRKSLDSTQEAGPRRIVVE
jgi:hypothetical protein